MSPHRPSLRLAVGLALFVLATTVASASAAPRQVSATPAPVAFPASSCQGTDACTDAVGPIGENSCNGDFACLSTLVAIGDNSCNGDTACAELLGTTIGDNSCNGTAACTHAVGPIGDNSCNGEMACAQTGGAVGDNSCIGESACNGADSVGDNSCSGDLVCFKVEGAIGNCEGNTVQPAACDTQPDGRIRRIGRHKTLGAGIINTDGTDQTLTYRYRWDRSMRFAIKFRNDSDVPDSFKIRADCGFSGPAVAIVVDYGFVHGWPARDISDALYAGTYTTNSVAPQGVFRLRAIVSTNTPPGTGEIVRLSCLVTAESVGNPANVDAVGFKVNFDVFPPP